MKKLLIIFLAFLGCNIFANFYVICEEKDDWEKKISLSFNFTNKATVYYIKTSKNNIQLISGEFKGFDGAKNSNGKLTSLVYSFTIEQRGIKNKCLVIFINLSSSDKKMAFNGYIYINLNTIKGRISLNKNSEINYIIRKKGDSISPVLPKN